MPAVFELDEDGGPTVVLDPQPPLDLLGDLREAETLCPTQAIRVEMTEET
jgi:ferredoxin